MGVTTLQFGYGGDEPLTLDIEVPQRILGVDHEAWECYADRPPEGFALGPHNDWVAGCGGWGSQQLRSGSTMSPSRRGQPVSQTTLQYRHVWPWSLLGPTFGVFALIILSYPDRSIGKDDIL